MEEVEEVGGGTYGEARRGGGDAGMRRGGRAGRQRHALYLFLCVVSLVVSCQLDLFVIFNLAHGILGRNW